MNTYEKALNKIRQDQKCRPTCVIPIIKGGVTGPTGPQGIEGPTGPIGPAPNFQIGSVVTGEPGTPASVTLTPVSFYQSSYYTDPKGGIK